MRRLSSTALIVFLITFATGAQTPAPKAPAGLDVVAIDRAIGRSGTILGDVYKISFPRTDLSVTVDGVAVKAGFALGSWAAFKSSGTGAVVHGDLVLLGTELNPVISGLQQHNFDITAIHNHLINETPSVMYVHYWGQGSAVTLAQNLKDALSHSKTPMTPPSTVPAGASAAKDDLPADAIQQAIGLKGTVSNGVLALSQPRPEKIQMMGVTLPPSMGMATPSNFQAAGP